MGSSVVQDVEAFEAKLQLGRFRNIEILVKVEIQISDAGPSYNAHSRIPVTILSRDCKRARIEPSLPRLMEAGGSGSPARLGRSVAPVLALSNDRTGVTGNPV